MRKRGHTGTSGTICSTETPLAGTHGAVRADFHKLLTSGPRVGVDFTRARRAIAISLVM